MTREEAVCYMQEKYFEKKYPNFKFIIKTSSSLLCPNTMGVKTTVKLQYNNNKSAISQFGEYCFFRKNTRFKELELAADRVAKGLFRFLKRGWLKIGVKRKKYYDKCLEEWSWKYITHKRVYFKKWEFVK